MHHARLLMFPLSEAVPHANRPTTSFRCNAVDIPNDNLPPTSQVTVPDDPPLSLLVPPGLQEHGLKADVSPIKDGVSQMNASDNLDFQPRQHDSIISTILPPSRTELRGSMSPSRPMSIRNDAYDTPPRSIRGTGLRTVVSSSLCAFAIKSKPVKNAPRRPTPTASSFLCLKIAAFATFH